MSHKFDPQTLIRELPEVVRFVGNDAPANMVLQVAEAEELLSSVQRLNSDSVQPDDYAQIDVSLELQEPVEELSDTIIRGNVGYRGLTPQQRYQMITWLYDPTRPAPEPVRLIYVAQLETGLFDPLLPDNMACKELVRLLTNNTWSGHLAASRAVLLGFWHSQDGAALKRWLRRGDFNHSLLGVALGHLALLEEKIDVDLLQMILHQWLSVEPIPNNVVAMKLASIQESLGADLLQHALGLLPDEAKQMQPWRCTHRDLRIAIAQPDLESVLRPLLVEPFTVDTMPSVNQMPSVNVEQPKDDPEEAATPVDEEPLMGDKWNLVLEFSHSRSEYFDFALMRAKQRPGFSQIMDEDRNLIYRVIYAKNEMRHFWRIWEYVQKWSATKVYVNGKELEQWKVWPYSQYMR